MLTSHHGTTDVSSDYILWIAIITQQQKRFFFFRFASHHVSSSKLTMNSSFLASSLCTVYFFGNTSQQRGKNHAHEGLKKPGVYNLYIHPKRCILSITVSSVTWDTNRRQLKTWNLRASYQYNPTSAPVTKMFWKSSQHHIQCYKVNR